MEAGGDSRPKDYPASPGLKVIIMGSKAEFKSQAANGILCINYWNLNREIVKSELIQNTVWNRPVTLVITPGWWKSFTLAESAKSLKMELMHSLTLCPDPHAFLLVINLHTPFTDTHLNSVVEHMEILGEQIWNHTIVLLIYDNKEEKNADTQQLIQRGGPEFHNIIKKCGNRVHVFNYIFKGGIHVEKLFMEIENLAALNKGEYFKVDSRVLESTEENRMMVKKRTEERQMEVETKLQILKEHLRETFFSELRIVLMGRMLAGKTSVMNTILKTKQEVTRTKMCVMREGEVEKRKVILIDTPGWWPYASIKETPKLVRQEIMLSVNLCSPGPHAVLLVLQSGVVFSEAYGNSIKRHMELLGRNVWSHCIVVFTRGDWMGTPTIEEHIESEGEALQSLISQCGNRYHVLNNMQDDEKQVRELIEKVEMMARQNKELLTPIEEEIEESDSGCGSNISHQDKLERGSLNMVPPHMDKVQEDYVTKWLENSAAVSVFSKLAEDNSEDISMDSPRA